MSRSLKQKILCSAALMWIGLGSAHAYDGPIQLKWSAEDAPTSSSVKVLDESSCNWAQTTADFLAQRSAAKVQLGADMADKKYVLRITPSVTYSDALALRPKAFFNWTGEILEGDQVINRFELKEDEKLSSLKTCADLKSVINDFVDNTNKWLGRPRHKIKIARQIALATPNAIDPVDYRETCNRRDTDLAELIKRNADEYVEIVESQGQLSESEPRLLLTAISGRIVGGHIYTGKKWLTIKGELYQGKEVKGSFLAEQTTLSAWGINPWGMCGVAERLFSKMSEDIAKWIKTPTLDAKLGDAK